MKQKMVKKNEQLEDARRQGQFEGEVKTTLTSIHIKVEELGKNMILNQGAMERRLRTVEDVTGDIPELRKHVDGLADSVSSLVRYQSVQRGVMIVLGILSTVITPVITALIISYLVR